MPETVVGKAVVIVGVPIPSLPDRRRMNDPPLPAPRLRATSLCEAADKLLARTIGRCSVLSITFSEAGVSPPIWFALAPSSRAIAWMLRFSIRLPDTLLELPLIAIPANPLWLDSLIVLSISRPSLPVTSTPTPCGSANPVTESDEL